MNPKEENNELDIYGENGIMPNSSTCGLQEEWKRGSNEVYSGRRYKLDFSLLSNKETYFLHCQQNLITMPPHRTAYSSASSLSSSSSFNTVFNRRRYPRRPTMNLNSFATFVEDDDMLDEALKVLEGRPDLVWRTVMVRHLWLTERRLRREAQKQRDEAEAIWRQLKKGGIDQYIAHAERHEDEEPSSSERSGRQQPSSSPEVPASIASSSGTQVNPIVIEDDDDDQVVNVFQNITKREGIP